MKIETTLFTMAIITKQNGKNRAARVRVLLESASIALR